MVAASLVATTFAEHASLWSIRLAMLVMVAVFASELRGAKATSRIVAMLWTMGAFLALSHSLGSLITFHHGSQTAALESTAQQTQALLGFRFGAGLYVNYLFVLVWLVDALLRLIAANRYERLPRAYSWYVNGFLIFIAVNGAIVFKDGWIRSIGIGCLIGLAALAVAARRKKA